MSEVFTFVDATHLISKATLWQERDKAIDKKLEKLKKLKNKTPAEVATEESLKQKKSGNKAHSTKKNSEATLEQKLEIPQQRKRLGVCER